MPDALLESLAVRLLSVSLGWNERIEGSRTVLEGGRVVPAGTEVGSIAWEGVEAAAGIDSAEADEFLAAAAGTDSGLPGGFGRWLGRR